MDKKKLKKRNKAGMSAVLAFSVALVVEIWCLRFAVGYFAIIMSASDEPIFSVREGIVNGIFGTLRTFSMEEEYGEYIKNIKNLIPEIIPSDARCFSLVQTCVLFYASILNLIAPIVGGAIILEILASVFQKIRLKILHLAIWRKKYYFSELNSTSLALAKSIYKRSITPGSKMGNPVLIFTDTYIDDEKEKEYELLLEAKQFGAICVRDDLAHVIKPFVGKCEYYLMDENEFGNFQTLMSLTEDNNIRYLKNSNIYLFVQSDAYVQIEKQINEKFKERSKYKECFDTEENKDSKNEKVIFKDGEQPTIIPVFGYRNLVHNLFVDVPLYETLIHKKNKKELKVTILGNGIIGTEAFLSAYWFGQILVSGKEKGGETIDECQLSINVISKDDEGSFWSKIDYINSEIKDTVKLINNSDSVSNNELLKYDIKGNTNNPYCNVQYVNADVKLGGFWNKYSEQKYGLLDSDYFIVALGNDADNISVSDKLRRLIGEKHLGIKNEDDISQVIVACAVFNPELANTLNNQRHYQCGIKGKTDIYMYAFGGLEEVYSCDNVYMSKNKLRAEGIGAAYDSVRMLQNHVGENKSRATNDDKNYNHWADLARAMHIKYKAFSLGLIEKSVFDYSSSDYHLYEDYVKERCKLYKQLALNKSVSDESNALKKAVQSKMHMLAWLEHRRWNAFTRTMGYRSTKEMEKNLQLNERNHKNMDLKLHPCLVEARKPTSNGNYINNNENWKALFKSFPADFNAEDLNEPRMIDLLEKKKCYLEGIKKKHGEYDSSGCDALDRMAFEWCEIAVDKSIEIIKETHKFLERDNNFEKSKIEEELQNSRKQFKDAWNGIGYYDFKKYDYFESDYDDYLTDKEVSKILKVNEGYVQKRCIEGKFKNAEYIKTCSEWHIPFKSVSSEIEKLYRKLDSESKDDKAKIEKHNNFEDDGVIEILGTWYEEKTRQTKKN